MTECNNGKRNWSIEFEYNNEKDIAKQILCLQYTADCPAYCGVDVQSVREKEE